LDKYWQAGFRAVFCRSCERACEGIGLSGRLRCDSLALNEVIR
jgi:hypothetical protein